MNKILLIGLTISILVLFVLLILWPSKEVDDQEPVMQEVIGVNPVPEVIDSNCEFTEMIFYYSEYCGWCNKVKEDGSIGKLEKLGVQVESLDVNKNVRKHKFDGVPTFVADDVVYSGYRTIDELKELLGCN